MAQHRQKYWSLNVEFTRFRPHRRVGNSLRWREKGVKGPQPETKCETRRRRRDGSHWRSGWELSSRTDYPLLRGSCASAWVYYACAGASFRGSRVTGVLAPRPRAGSSLGHLWWTLLIGGWTLKSWWEVLQDTLMSSSGPFSVRSCRLRRQQDIEPAVSRWSNVKSWWYESCWRVWGLKLLNYSQIRTIRGLPSPVKY